MFYGIDNNLFEHEIVNYTIKFISSKRIHKHNNENTGCVIKKYIKQNIHIKRTFDTIIIKTLYKRILTGFIIICIIIDKSYKKRILISEPKITQ